MFEFRAQLKEGGRLIIPSKIRKQLHFSVGDELLLKVEGNELHVLSLGVAVKQAQFLAQKYNKSKVKLTDVLFEMRREEND
jgi:bifunctional DNA-binding transcriptional regulator/antitoxin component of YhaV-PrlF toxin-antitoxin module